VKRSYRSDLGKKIVHDPAALEELAAEILGYLAEDPARLSRFLDLTGLNPQSLRRTAALPGFAASLLEYLASDDRLILAFATDRGHDPAKIEAMRQRLAQPLGD
jgi:hypothetical protein